MKWVGKASEAVEIAPGVVANTVIPSWQEYKLLNQGENNAAKIALGIDGFLYVTTAVAFLAPDEAFLARAVIIVASVTVKGILGYLVESKLRDKEG